jgi:hypothetical protein
LEKWAVPGPRRVLEVITAVSFFRADKAFSTPGTGGKIMPLIEREDKQPDEKLEVRLRPEVALDLRSYQQFADNSQHHVISAALRYPFEADQRV